jgi:hypothetical protein
MKFHPETIEILQEEGKGKYKPITANWRVSYVFLFSARQEKLLNDTRRQNVE